MSFVRKIYVRTIVRLKAAIVARRSAHLGTAEHEPSEYADASDAQASSVWVVNEFSPVPPANAFRH